MRSRCGKERINLAAGWEGWRRGRNLGRHSGLWLGQLNGYGTLHRIRELKRGNRVRVLDKKSL